MLHGERDWIMLRTKMLDLRARRGTPVGLSIRSTHSTTEIPITFSKMSHQHNHGHDHSHEDEQADASAQSIIWRPIDFESIRTLNETTTDSGAQVVEKTWPQRLNPEPELVSDADEQLLMFIP